MTLTTFRRPNRLLGPITLVAPFAGLSGCAGKIRYPSYYVTDLTAPGAATKTKPILGPVAVREFGAPEYLLSGPIVYRLSPGQLGFYDYHRWAVDPRSAMTTAMIQRDAGAASSNP